MCMLYWSSVLIEKQVHHLRRDLSGIKNDIFALRTQTDAIRDEVLRAIIRYQEQWHDQDNRKKKADFSQPTSERSQIDASFPNLLSEDPFYTETLPQLLGPNFRPFGTFRQATIGKPDNLHPFSNWSMSNLWNSMCGLSVARMQIGKYETFSPNMAIKIESRMRKDVPVPEFWVHLRDNVFWQPLSEKMFSGNVQLAPQFLRKHRVSARDFKFFFDAVMNPHVQEPGAVALRAYLSDIEEVQVIDDLTFVVKWQPRDVTEPDGKVIPKIRYVAKMWTGALNPLPAFVFQYFSDGTKIVQDDRSPDTYRTNSIWAQNFSQHWAKNIIVSCGPWIFEEMTDRRIAFRRNPDHFFPLDSLAKRSEYVFKNTPDNVWQAFKSHALDAHILLPDQVIEQKMFQQSQRYRKQAAQGYGIESIHYHDRSYLYIGWNMVRPFFQSKKVRQAMTMAIDRKRIIKQYLNGMGRELTGPFSPFSAAYDNAILPWAYDPVRARRYLEEEGWYDRDGDGIIDKEVDGKRISFEFSLLYYVKNPTTRSICEYIATALKEVGVRCLLNGVDIADLSAAFDDKEFDALCLAWGLGTPPEDPRQLWHSDGAKQPGSSNIVGFSNAEADKLIDELDFAYDPVQRLRLYHRFHRIIHEEQPYTFLYTPKRLMLYREYLQNVFIPIHRQDLIPGADVAQPVPSIFWIKPHSS